jgi:FkbM family methyltransferase
MGMVARCASLGGNLQDKLFLALFGLIAPRQDRSRARWWRVFASAIPAFWVRPKPLNGFRLLINPTDWSQTVIFEEVFLQSSYDLTKVKFTPDVILDCGAHIGIFSLLARSTFPGARLTAYEPNPRNVRRIRCQISRNDLDMDLVESAVSIETKRLFFKAGRNSHAGVLLHDGSKKGTYEVPVIDLPAALKQMQPASLLLKMDVEGEERSILPALVPILPRQSALFFETHAGEAGWREVEALLISNGFQVEKISVYGQCVNGFACRE